MPRSKSQTIYAWKKYGLIYDNYDDLYEVYIKTMQCQHCQTEFTEKNKRCLDHNHETGMFRKIVCNRCNSKDSYINYPKGYAKKEYQQEYQRANKEEIKEYQQAYRRANKERIKEQDKQKIECDCGLVVCRKHIARHKLTKKHSDYIASSLV